MATPPVSPPSPAKSFHWRDSESALAPFAGATDIRFDPRLGAFAGQCSDTRREVRITPPPVLPLPEGLCDDEADDSAQAFARRVKARRLGGEAPGGGPSDLRQFLDAIPDALPLHCVILMQAGATSLAMMLEGEALKTKSFKRYVIRGNGKAQPTFLAQKGKSRYGARLRLQNAQRMLQETNERIAKLWGEFGDPERILVSAPKRLWAEFVAASPNLPFTKEAVTRVGLDVDVPTTEVLLRTYRRLEHGRIQWL